MNAPLDFANRVEIFGYAVAIICAKTVFEVPDLIYGGIENAALLLDAVEALLRV